MTEINDGGGDILYKVRGFEVVTRTWEVGELGLCMRNKFQCGVLGTQPQNGEEAFKLEK